MNPQPLSHSHLAGKWRWVWLASGVALFGILMMGREERSAKWERALMAGAAAASLVICITKYRNAKM